MTAVWTIQHHDEERPGTLLDALELRGVRTRTLRPYAGDSLPAAPGKAAGLIVLGGPQSVYEADEHPYLTDEMDYIRAMVMAGKPVLGICLGSQLLAAALGGKVRPAPRPEIGFGDVELTEQARRDPLFVEVPQRFPALHWHGDVFQPPEGAVPLARSRSTQHQAFRFGRSAYGLLFHVEMTEDQLERMALVFEDDLAAAGLDSSELRAEARQHLPHVQRVGARVFGRWADLLQVPVPA